MTREWATTDYYALLEVEPDVDPDVLKRAYRRMAQVHHPDANPGDPGAADRFRRIAQAYAVLSDLAQKAIYDRVQAKEYRSRTPDAPDFPDVDELIAASGAILGRHIVTPLTVPLEHVVKGAAVTVEVDGLDAIVVDIPPGVEDGDIVRVEGLGRVEDDVTGDLIVIIHVPRHAYFVRDGDNLHVSREINVSDLALGVRVSIPTLHGPTALQVPPGTQPGQIFELEGYGIRYPDRASGVLNVRIEASSGGIASAPADKGAFAGLMEILDDDDVEVIATVGSTFNSEVHEVVGKVEPGNGPLIVTGEIRRGYLVKGQVIRPALVTVTRKGDSA